MYCICNPTCMYCLVNKGQTSVKSNTVFLRISAWSSLKLSSSQFWNIVTWLGQQFLNRSSNAMILSKLRPFNVQIILDYLNTGQFKFVVTLVRFLVSTVPSFWIFCLFTFFFKKMPIHSLQSSRRWINRQTTNRSHNSIHISPNFG